MFELEKKEKKIRRGGEVWRPSLIETMGQNISNPLLGNCLVAAPSMIDTPFAYSVILLCNLSFDMNMGIVINKPLYNFKFSDFLLQLDIKATKSDLARNPPDILVGGPVETSKGLVVHSSDYLLASTLIINDSIAITSTLDILKAVAEGNGPKKLFITLGYVSWTEEQLERNLKNNSWLIVPATSELVFDTPVNYRWQKAYDILGVEPSLLFAGGGTA